MLRSLRLPAVVAALGLLLAAAISATDAPPARAVAPGNPDFQNTWARTDQPVASSEIARTWIWGPEANYPVQEEQYNDSPGDTREVQYFDKSRMEINDPNGDRSDPFFVTNGLLVVELMTGRMQVGDNDFETHLPADIPVAGDPDDATGPTYLGLAGLRASPPADDGDVIIRKVDRNGVISEDESLASWGITAAYHVQVPGIDHQVASVFWTFMNSSGLVFVDGAYSEEPLFENPFYATGYPLTDPYFAMVKVAGEPRLVLIQCFERRCLTWTPGNSPGFETEAGNVGLHYHYWRYVLIPLEGNQTPTATATRTATPTETATETETATGTATEEPGLTYAYDSAWGGEADADTALSFPLGVATDSDGNVYVTDSDNDRIVKYDNNGNWLDTWGTTGNDEGEFSAPNLIFVGSVQGSETVMVADSANDRIQQFGLTGNFQLEFGHFGNDDGEFDYPTGVAARNTNIFVVDSQNDRVQRFSANNPNGGPNAVWGESGNGPGEFNSPYGIAVSNTGFVFVVDSGNSRVQVFNAQGDYDSQFGSFGDGEDEFLNPAGIAIDEFGRAFVVDQELGVVKVFERNNDEWSEQGTIGEPGEGPGEFTAPNGIAIDPDGNVFVTDIGTNSVLKFGPFDDGADFITSWSGGEQGHFTAPAGIALGNDDQVFVTDTVTNLVQIFTTDGNFIQSFGGEGNDPGLFDGPSDVAVDSLGRIYIADSGNGRVQKFNPQLTYLYDIGETGTGEGEIDEPVAVAVDSGFVYVADAGNERVKVFTDKGDFVTEWGSEGDNSDFDGITGIAVADGIVYVVEQGMDRVQMFQDDGDYIDSFGIGGVNTGKFGRPSRVAVSLDGYVYVTDESRSKVLIFTSDGEFVSEFGTGGQDEGEIDSPVGVAVDSDNNVYVVDAGNFRVQKWVPAE